MIEPLDVRLATLTSEVQSLGRAIERLPAGEASVASATEAALVLSRAARVIESDVAALAAPRPGEIVVTASQADAERIAVALADFHILVRHVAGPLVVFRADLP
jgi:hypothetical protein